MKQGSLREGNKSDEWWGWFWKIGMDWGRKNSCVGGEDLKSRITTFHPAPSFLQASACLISLHDPRLRTRVFYCLCALPCLVNPRSSGIKYEAAGPYPRSLCFGIVALWLIPGNCPFTQQTGAPTVGQTAELSLGYPCTLSSPEKVGT